MNHLTVDEIIEFVSSNDADQETLLLISRVNQHIRTCDECFKNVKAFQLIYDEFIRLADDEEFRDYVYNTLEKDTIDKMFVDNSVKGLIKEI